MSDRDITVSLGLVDFTRKFTYRTQIVWEDGARLKVIKRKGEKTFDIVDNSAVDC